LQKTAKNSVFLTFFSVFPLENPGRLTEERPVQKRPPKRLFHTFLQNSHENKSTAQKNFIKIFNKEKYFTTKKLITFYKAAKNLTFDQILTFSLNPHFLRNSAIFTQLL
jgi:hypothetical protein